MTSLDALERWAREAPDRVALVDGKRRMTYAEYHAAVHALAARWIELGLTRSDVIAIQLPNWIEFAVVIGAAVAAGIPFCQVHQAFRSKEIAFVLEFTGARLMIVPERFGNHDYRDEGLPIVIAEQNVTWVIPIADRAYLIDTGKIVAEGPPSELAADDMLVEHYLGV